MIRLSLSSFLLFIMLLLGACPKQEASPAPCLVAGVPCEPGEAKAKTPIPKFTEPQAPPLDSRPRAVEVVPEEKEDTKTAAEPYEWPSWVPQGVRDIYEGIVPPKHRETISPERVGGAIVVAAALVGIYMGYQHLSKYRQNVSKEADDEHQHSHNVGKSCTDYSENGIYHFKQGDLKFDVNGAKFTEEILKKLRNGTMNFTAVLEKSQYPLLHLAVLCGDDLIVDEILHKFGNKAANFMDNFGNTAIHLEALQCNDKILSVLLDHDVSFDTASVEPEALKSIPDRNGIATPLHLATLYCSVKYLERVLTGLKKENKEKVLAAINRKDEENRTPFIYSKIISQDTRVLDKELRFTDLIDEKKITVDELDFSSEPTLAKKLIPIRVRNE